MNWLHRSNFTRRETRFEQFFRSVIQNFQNQSDDDPEEFGTLEFMIFSRPIISQRTETIEAVIEVEQDFNED